ncbi:hypothetical protein J6590_031664 [Homalodisca vitripennis]|nr:hypothetical protein J6590_031664 [Homalodisca vitripennis]
MTAIKFRMPQYRTLWRLDLPSSQNIVLCQCAHAVPSLAVICDTPGLALAHKGLTDVLQSAPPGPRLTFIIVDDLRATIPHYLDVACC